MNEFRYNNPSFIVWRLKLIFKRLDKLNLKIVFVLLILLLINGRSFSQVINPGHAGKIQSGAGVVPYLNLPFTTVVQGNYAFILGVGTNNLEIVDITNPAAPAHKSSISLDGPSGCLFVSGNYVYIGVKGFSGVGYLAIIDVTNPESPVQIGSLTDGNGSAPFLNQIRSVFVLGNYAYIASNSSNAIEIVDITKPSKPVHKGSLANGVGGAQLNGPASIYVKGNYAYVASYFSGALEIIDVTNPAAPVHKGSILNGSGGALLSLPTSVYVSGNLAYLTCRGNNALEIIDVTNPAVPAHKGSLIDGGGVAPFISGFNVGSSSVNVSGNYAYISSQSRNAIEIVDVSNPSTPIHKSSITDGTGGALLTNPLSVFLGGNYLYIASQGNNALEILDVTNPATPAHKGSLISSPGGALLSDSRGVFVSGNYAYVASNGSNALAIIDISDAKNPVYKSGLIDGGGTTPYLSGAVSVYVSGNYAYVASAISNALEIIDITNPIAPLHKGSLLDGGGIAPFLNRPISVFVKGNYAYIASQNSSALEIVDVSNPSVPVHKGSLVDGAGGATLSGSSSVFVSGNYAYVAAQSSDALEIIDVTKPASPVHKSKLVDGAGVAPYLGFPSSVVVAGNYAYVASYDSDALEIIDVSNPSAPVHKSSLNDGAGSIPYLTAPVSVFVSGNYAYIARQSVGHNGLEIVDITNPAAPAHKAELTTGKGGALLRSPASVYVTGNYVYVTSTVLNGLEIINNYSPVVSSFSPKTGPVGTSVIITGNNFNTLITADFNGVPATISGPITLTSAVVTVPTGATIGNLSVAFNSSPQSGSSNFIVTPTATTATNSSQTSFNANWTDVGATTYFLDLSTDNFNTYVSGYSNFSVGNVTTANVTGLQSGTTYQYRIRSTDGTTASGNSNSITATTIPATPVAYADTVSQTGFIAKWSTITGATDYHLDVSTDPQFNSFVFGGNNFYTLRTSQTVSGLEPYKTYYFRVRSANTAGTSPSSNIITVHTIDNFAPSILSPATQNATTVTQGNTPTLGATITDNVNVAYAKMFYRGISKQNYDSIALQGPGGVGGSYSVVLQSTWYDSLGLEYYFVGKDPSGNKTVTESFYIQLITPSISLPTLPFGASQSDYRIIAFPYTLNSDNEVPTVYNNVPWNDNTKAGMWWWNPTEKNGAGAYDQYGGKSTTLKTVEPGKGYWAITSTPVTPQLTNVPAPLYNQSKLFSMKLKPNWNEIGNPYPVAISWDDVIAFNAINNPDFNFSPLNIYDGSGFKTVTGTSLLKPFEGGFVKNLGTTDITIQIPFPAQKNTTGRLSYDQTDISQDAWNIYLHISQEQRINQLGGFGMNPLACTGEDRLDNFNPPHFTEEPEINFTHTEYPTEQFSNDMVKSQDEYIWRFTPSGILNKPAELHWNTPDASSSWQLFLLDVERLQVTDMRTTSRYNFQLTNASNFRIYYGRNIESKITTSQIVVSEPYPNPLTSDLSSSLNVSLPDESTVYLVNLQIFNGQGVMLQSTNQILNPGIHAMKFSFGNSLLTTGKLFFYRVVVSHEKTSQVFTGKIIAP